MIKSIDLSENISRMLEEEYGYGHQIDNTHAPYLYLALKINEIIKEINEIENLLQEV